jgi:phosphodiesterase/alkaline phosphatase D-like protein
VAVAVAVAVAVGVGVGDPPLTAANISTRPHPYTLFGGPAVPHCVEEINTAELFKAVRLASI